MINTNIKILQVKFNLIDIKGFHGIYRIVPFCAAIPYSVHVNVLSWRNQALRCVTTAIGSRKLRRNNAFILELSETREGTVARLRMWQNTGCRFGFQLLTAVHFLFADFFFNPDFHKAPIAFCILWERIHISPRYSSMGVNMPTDFCAVRRFKEGGALSRCYLYDFTKWSPVARILKFERITEVWTRKLLVFRQDIPFVFNLLKTKPNLLYIRNQTVPRSKHFPPRL